MLVLSREVGQRIVIDDGRIVIEVMDIKGCRKVRIGVIAPPEVTVHREEIQRRVDREKGWRE